MKLTSVHGPWSNRIHRHSFAHQLLWNTASKVLNGSFGSSICSVVTGKGREQGSHYGDQFATLLNIDSAGFQDEESSLGIDANIGKSAFSSFQKSLSTKKEQPYANILSYSSSDTSVMGFFNTIPIVFTTILILPKSLTTSANNLSTAAAVVKSAA